ncbi:MAG TPA: PQQ-binding-like beta-propeller repeat protein [Actinomycetota bacterium]
MIRRLALLGVGLAALLAAISNPSEGRANLPLAAQRSDWATYGFDLQRSGFNPDEIALGPRNAGKLHVLWRRSLDGVAAASPVVASRVRTAGGPVVLVYAGTEHGTLVALNAATGKEVWRDRLGSVRTACYDLPDHVAGISGTPVIDRSTGRLYVSVADGPRSLVFVYAVSLATGIVSPGWPVTISTDPTHMHVWGALTLRDGTLYVTMASLCDASPSYGRVVAIDTRRARIAARWFVVHDAGSVVGGGGIWGYGGASIDPSDGSVYVATGNAFRPEPEGQPYADRVVRLTPSLELVDSHHPSLTGRDVDFGTTPMLFRPPGCPPLLAAENKVGSLFVYDRDAIGEGPMQRIQIAGNASEPGLGRFIGLPAYSPVTGLVYVSNPGPDAPPFVHGMVALRLGPDCRLHLAWQSGVPTGTMMVSSPTVANGVVYFGTGGGGRVFAFDAATGSVLWNSGRSMGGGVFAPPVVVDGMVFAASWIGSGNGEVVAFGP